MATITFQQGASYQGTIDTRLVEFQPSETSWGEAVSLGVDSSSNGRTVQSLLAFTNIFGSGAGQIPVGSTITSATLTLTTTNPSTGGGSLHRMLIGWTELSTWSALNNGVQTDGIEAVTFADLNTGSVSKGTSTFDVTGSLQAWLSGATTADQANAANLGWLFNANNTDGWAFGSSESNTVPILTVTFSAPGGPPPPSLSLAGPVSAAEGSGSGSTAFVFTVNRSGDTSGTSSVNFAVSGTGSNAASDNDFTGGAFPSGSVSFAAGEASTTITVNVVRDSDVEPDETFLVTLSGASGAQISGATAVGTILNDDAGSTTSATVTFKQGSTYQGTIDTRLVEFAPNDTSWGEATSLGVDSSSSGKNVQSLLAFTNIFGSGAGQIPVGATITSATLTLTTTNPSTGGGSLHRMLTGWNEQSTWSALGNGVQTDGIEAVVSADLNTGSVAKGTTTFDVTASLQAWLSGASTATQANSANLGWVVKPNNSDGWAFGSSESGTVPVLTVTYSIAGEPPPPPPPSQPTLALAGSVTMSEGTGSGSTLFVFTVNRAGSTTGTSSVHFTVSGTGTNPALANDFTGNAYPSGTVIFADGETSKTISIAVSRDSIVEASDKFLVTLSNASGAEITGPTAVGTISNDDSSTTILSVKSYATSAFGAGYGSNDPKRYGSVDPTDIAYHPGTGALYVVDSEVDETPFFSPNNLFQLNGQAAFQQSVSLWSFTKEPTGIAIGPDSVTGAMRMFIVDDDQARLFVVDAANPTVAIRSFSTTSFGAADPEDLAFNHNNGNLFVLSEDDRSIKEITQDGSLVRSIPLPSIIVTPEGLAYDSVNNLFFVVTGKSSDIFLVSMGGAVIETITALRNMPNPVGGTQVVPKGLELAPSSDGSGTSLWVTDYGIDQVADGRLFEILLGQRGTPSSALASTASADMTIAQFDVNSGVTLDTAPIDYLM